MVRRPRLGVSSDGHPRLRAPERPDVAPEGPSPERLRRVAELPPADQRPWRATPAEYAMTIEGNNTHSNPELLVPNQG